MPSVTVGITIRGDGGDEDTWTYRTMVPFTDFLGDDRGPQEILQERLYYILEKIFECPLAPPSKPQQHPVRRATDRFRVKSGEVSNG